MCACRFHSRIPIHRVLNTPIMLVGHLERRKILGDRTGHRMEPVHTNPLC